MSEHLWRVVPISDHQKLDVRLDDLIEGGLYRRCLTYRGGGGYDQFPQEFKQLYGSRPERQFIVQLFGCNLDCPYCYVTRAGVWGSFRPLATSTLVESYRRAQHTHGVDVFHLMGGAPALQLKFWPELIAALQGEPFHSDLMLTESVYDIQVLKDITRPRCLYAVNIKGADAAQFRVNTRKELDEEVFWRNLFRLELLSVPYYFTLTALGDREAQFLDEVENRIGRIPPYHSISLISYNALPYVDSVEWGG